MKLKRRTRTGEDFQMAPMIDMVFLLLVFFMCVSSLAQADKAVPVDLPESEESKIPEDLANRGIITLQECGAIYLGANEVTLGELKEGISRALRETPRLRIQVRADGTTRFEHIQQVLKTCAEAGAIDVVYSTHQSR